MSEPTRASYRETLQTLGALCDERGWRNLRIVEGAEGLILQYSVGDNPHTFATHLYTPEHLRDLARDLPPANAGQ